MRYLLTPALLLALATSGRCCDYSAAAFRFGYRSSIRQYVAAPQVAYYTAPPVEYVLPPPAPVLQYVVPAPAIQYGVQQYTAPLPYALPPAVYAPTVPLGVYRPGLLPLRRSRLGLGFGY